MEQMDYTPHAVSNCATCGTHTRTNLITGTCTECGQ